MSPARLSLFKINLGLLPGCGLKNRPPSLERSELQSPRPTGRWVLKVQPITFLPLALKSDFEFLPALALANPLSTRWEKSPGILLAGGLE